MKFEELLEVRESIKKRKPDFVRQDAHRFKHKKGEKWRRPKGVHSKLRLKKAGHGRLVSVGYRGPKETKGVSKDGLRTILVSTVSELAALNNNIEGIIISGAVGTKKRVEIVKAAAEKGFQIFNVKDVQGFIENVNKKFEERRKASTEKEAKKKEKKKVATKKKEKAEKKEEKVEEEKKETDKKEEEKREAEKVMIKKS